MLTFIHCERSDIYDSKLVERLRFKLNKIFYLVLNVDHFFNNLKQFRKINFFEKNTK